MNINIGNNFTNGQQYNYSIIKFKDFYSNNNYKSIKCAIENCRKSALFLDLPLSAGLEK